MTKEELAELLRSALTAAGAAGLPGTEAAQLIRSRAPTFRPQDFGAASVKDFICGVVPAKVIGRAGMDVVFGLPDAPELQPAGGTPEPRDWNPWRTWATPTSGRYLSVSQKGELAVQLGTPSATDLGPLPEEEHRAIAEAFLSTIPIDEAELRDLRKLLTLPGWWRAWVTRMRADQARNLRWLAYRSKALDARLVAHVSSLGLSDFARDAALEGMRASRRAEAQRKPRARSTDKAPAQTPSRRDMSTHGLAHRVLDLLSEEQVRSLSFPLGAVLDALGR